VLVDGWGWCDGDSPYRVKLTVRDYNSVRGGEQTRLHALEAIEIETPGWGTNQTGETSWSSGTGNPTGRTISIAHLLDK
jgi:hypothetical protein